jgi:chemotaxis protein histidine kinase CheA
MSLLRLDDAVRQNGKASNVVEQDQCFLVVVKASDSDADRPVAIAVEALMDQQEVVVKSLSGYLGRARGIAGASILGDGQVVLILDIPVLIKAAQQQAAVGAVEGERRAS